ncbi:MAG: DMT family transporter [Eubacteriaceae bacterium]|nr:DMT family transporter [Eubacteriaceae bacterium]
MKKNYHPYAMTTIICWSFGYVFTRYALRYVSALPLGFLRYFFASIALGIVALAYKIKPPKGRDLAFVALAGICGFFMYMVTINQGNATVPASESSVIIATAPAITAIIARFAFGEFLNKRQVSAIILQFAGVMVVMDTYSGFVPSKGYVMLLGAACLISVYNALQRDLTKRHNSLDMTIYSIFFGEAALCLFAPMALRELPGIGLQAWATIVFLGVFSSGLAYASWAKALSIANKAASVANYMFLTPFVTSILGFLLLGEVPSKPTLIGGGIILVGMLFFNYNPKEQASNADSNAN